MFTSSKLSQICNDDDDNDDNDDDDNDNVLLLHLYNSYKNNIKFLGKNIILININIII
jgi:hypothetical protein